MYSKVVTQQAFDALELYFDILEQVGYMRSTSVERLLALLVVDDFLNTDINTFVSEEDYKLISSFLYCIYGRDCLTPYPQFVNEIPQMGTILPQNGGLQPFRVTEERVYRTTEEGQSRQTEYRTEFWK